MARIRCIKPEFPQSESMGRISRDSRLAFIQLWTLADDEGRLRGNSRMLASLLFPYDDDAPGLIDSWLGELEAEKCIVRYKHHDQSYIEICNWLIHQKIDKPTKSKIPKFDESSREFASVREVSSEEGKGSKDQGSKDQGSKEGIKEPKQKNPPKERAPAATRPDDVSEKVWASWCELRKKHKATACEVAVEQARKEADKARISLEEFFTLWISSGYRGFKADWIKPANQAQSKTTIAPVTPRGPGEYRGQDDKPIPF